MKKIMSFTGFTTHWLRGNGEMTSVALAWPIEPVNMPAIRVSLHRRGDDDERLISDSDYTLSEVDGGVTLTLGYPFDDGVYYYVDANPIDGSRNYHALGNHRQPPKRKAATYE